MLDSPYSEAFLTALRSALQNLYDPARLRDSPLLALLDLEGHYAPILALRETLIEAIRALRPRADVPPESNAWRLYHILVYRYIEQSTVRMVASNIGLSERQLRRAERDAEEMLADYVWTRYALEARAEAVLAPAPSGSGGTDGVPVRDRELEWMRSSFPNETANLAEVIAAVGKTVAPLMEAAGVRVVHDIAEGLPSVTGQLSALRQALMNLLMAAARLVPAGRVRLSAARECQGLCIRVEAHDGAEATPPAAITEQLEMARQFSDLFGSTLEIAQGKDRPLRAALWLPTEEQALVLVIDDNADTLRLLERYLTGSRYRFIGLRDPEEALEVAAECRPQVVVLDVMLPNIDDWELLGRFRTHPAMQGVPIIVCTILPQEELALALGAAAFLRKPVSRQEFLAALDRQTGRPWTESR